MCIINHAQKNLMKAFARIRTSSKCLASDNGGAWYSESVMGVAIAVVLGLLIMSAIYLLYQNNILPDLGQKIEDAFNFSA